MLPGFPALDLLGGAGAGLSASSSATATGGTIGSFNFSPNSKSTLLLAGLAVLGLLLLLRKG
jgi:hypothetical protein